MKPDWDSLAAEFEGSDKVLIADVDCTGAGEPLCEEHGVEGFPTIKTFAPPDTEGEDYEGGRSLEELREHAKSLGPGCSPSNKDACTAEQLVELEKLLAVPAEEVEAELTSLKAEVTTAQEKHDELVKSLQAQYESSEEEVGALKKKHGARMKVLRAALSGGGEAAAAAGKDEV